MAAAEEMEEKEEEEEEAEEEAEEGSLETIRDAAGGRDEETKGTGGGARAEDAAEAFFGSKADA